MAKKARPNEGQMVIRAQTLEFRTVDGSEDQYELSVSSEEPYSRYWGVEILQHDAQSVDLSVINDTGTFLYAHGRDPIMGKIPIGGIQKCWLDESARKLRAIVTFDSADEKAMLLKNKLDKNMIKGVSVGYNVSAWTTLQPGQKSIDGRFVGPAEIASQWTPMEISLEPTPADSSVGFGKSMDESEENEMGEKAGSAQTQTGGAVIPPAAQAAVPGAGSAGERGLETGAVAPSTALPQGTPDAASAERTRAAEITTLCRSFEVDPLGYIQNGATVDAVRAAILQKMQEERGALPVGNAGSGVQMVHDELDKVRSAATEGLLMRCGIREEKPAAGATEFRGMTLQQIAVECLIRSGVSDANRMGRDELFKRSMTPDSAFVSIASDVANRVVLNAHETAPTTYQFWTSKGTATDFRPTEFFEISEAGELAEIPQNGEFKEAQLSDQAVAVRRLLTFGRMITFTRQMFINDDIDLINRTLTKFTLAFGRGTNKAVYELLKKNPSMYDGNALFSGAHANLGTGAAPSTESFSEARQKMRKQKELGGNAIMNISPAFVLSSAADETEIEKMLVSLADPSSENSGVANIFKNKMKPIVDAELDVDSGAQPYYFAADPRLADTIEVSYLNGNESPTVESQVAFDQLGIRFRVFGDRGVTLLGYKGLFKNPGQA